MLGVVFLIAGIFGPARSVFAEPLATYPALEVSGRIDGSGATNGAFHLYVPLSAEFQRSLARLALTAGIVAAERVARERAEPAAEIVSLDETRAIVIWNARAFPAVQNGVASITRSFTIFGRYAFTSRCNANPAP